MSKFTLTLNSHSLSDFQRCEMLYGLSDLLCLQKSEEKKAFAKGSAIDKILNIYYYRKMKGRHLRCMSRLDLILKRFSAAAPMDEAHVMLNSLMAYFKQYSREDVEILGVQKGFSKVIYEDSDNLFIYEGCPDWFCRFPGSASITIVDNKTQSQRKRIYPFNNQALGYCWGFGVNRFVYNYITFVKTDPVRREAHEFKDSQIETWKNDTIQWYFRVKSAIEKRSFLRSWQCSNQYGNCDYAEVCSSVNEAMRTWVLKRDFVQVERHRSW